MKKKLNIIKKVIYYIIVGIAVLLMIFTILSIVFVSNNNRNIFGYKGFVVLTDSMKVSGFESGDLIFVKEVNPSTLKPGDIISYISYSKENYGDIVTHKIRSVIENNIGELGFKTYGTTTGVDDENVVLQSHIVGKYQFHIPKVGKLLHILKTPIAYVVCIAIPFFIFIFMQIFNTIKLFNYYKNEKIKMKKRQVKTKRKNIKKVNGVNRVKKRMMKKSKRKSK